MAKYSAWQDVIYSDDRCGTQFDDKLFAMMMDLNPTWVRTHAGIQDEASKLAKQYPKQLPSPDGELITDALHGPNHLLRKDDFQQ